MKQFSLRYLYAHLGEALKQMPFIITNHNLPIAKVVPLSKKDVDSHMDVAIDHKRIYREEEE